eukprot:5802720-Lingulodinium_polyedra.AAC.1
MFGDHLHVYPIDRTKVSGAQPGSHPRPGRDSRAPPPKESKCPACKHYCARGDWGHTREIGQRSFS